MTTVHAANAPHGAELYKFLRDEIGTQFMQFIPIVERDNDTGYQEGDAVTDRSVKSEQYGQFLIDIYEEWVRYDVGRTYVQIFDVALSAWVGAPPGLCIFDETCGLAMAMEHNGDVFSCDHYVEPDYKLGNIMDIPLSDIVVLDAQKKFGQDKKDTLPQYCLDCEVRFVCNGGCPKNRFIQTPDGEDGLNYLCAGYRAFFNHIKPTNDFMVNELKLRRPPANVMHWMRRYDAELEKLFAKAGRNDTCPCGSGKKFKKCHGVRRRVSSN